MLPAQSRLRDSDLISATVKRGKHKKRRGLVVHFLPARSVVDQPPRVAFAVNKSVGGSVVRHQVIRRLRHVMCGHLQELPPGSTLVIRALPAAATGSSVEFERDLSRLLPAVVGTCS